MRGAASPERSSVEQCRAAVAAGVFGLAWSLASHNIKRSQRRRMAGGLRAVALEKASSEEMVPANSDDVETSIAQFVPKISQLQNQAELLRSGELQEVISTMKALRKTELRGVFSEVDALLVALIDAIDGLRDSALTIRKSELRDHFDQADSDAENWVNALEQDASLGENSSDVDVETMMEVHVIGLSHHKAPVEVRQKLAVAEADWNKYAQELVEFARTANGFVVSEVAVLSTCNRFEIYFASPELKKYAALESVHAFLRQKSGLGREELDPVLFSHTGEAATTHLFEVASGLDSLVLGEAQILAQVKACHKHAIEKADPEAGIEVAGAGGKIITKMLNAGIRMGKLVRTKTKIGKGSVSVSSAAVELMMSKALQDLKKYSNNVKVSILGAGKMSRLLLLALFSKHPEQEVVVVNRNVENAQAVLEEDLVKARGGQNASVAGMDKMWDVVKSSDVVFAATGAKVPIINKEDLQDLERPLMLVDISVPLNIASDCRDVAGVHSYSVDDLKKVVQANAEKRQSEVLKAKKLINAEVSKFKLWQSSQGAVPYLAALQSMAESIRQTETDKMGKKLRGLHEKERQAVDKLTRHIIDKIFEPIYYSMKDDESVDAKKNKIFALKSMFKLEPEYKRRLLSQGQTPAGQLNA